MSVDKHNRPIARSDIKVQVIGEEVMLHDGDSDSIHVLNHTAYAVWKLCNGENTSDDIFEKLSLQYPDAGSELIDDIKETLRCFKQKKLLL